MSEQNLAVGYVLGEEHVAGRVVIDWIGVVYETREEADEALAHAHQLGESEMKLYRVEAV
ncbi:hypothetical protein [Rhodococcus sp. B10]|uniref:hypothetical protein n=1 Tax=Rhodococcus sp. B10 TaxID=2695876 RepID=UPI001431DB49|nr:hypothetical protein [Rhodococcus sp. B10]NIL76778.1 hypothetical protein [Rhodococcus sp. B10]